MINRENLKVYDKTIVFATSAEALSAHWSKSFAVTDHFLRAAESIVLNLAEAARLAAGSLKATTLDYAIGSSLEWAACLDIAPILGLIAPDDAFAEKQRLREITCMLVGLRKSWQADSFHEGIKPKDSEETFDQSKLQFHHESLDVYKVGLEFLRWLTSFLKSATPSKRASRQLDKATTSLILNIAEGNGRFSELDHGRFLDIAAAAAVRVVGYLDLCQQRALPTELDISSGRWLLTRVTAMLTKF